MHPFRARVAVAFLTGLTIVLSGGAATAAIFTVTTNADTGNGSLRKAITDANATPVFDEIRFNLPVGQRVITPATSLPVMTTPMDINGISQPGYAGVPLVSLNGATAGGTGLRGTANFCSVRGLAIYGFATGVRLEGAFSVVKSNYLGLTAAGAGGSGNSGVGLAMDGSFGSVGGTVAADRNIISGNAGGGMSIGAEATDLLIYGNYFGTNPAGTAAIGNGSYAIRSFGADNQIGTNSAGGGNLISGNQRGISLESDDPVGTSVRGNIIGLNAAGTAAIPNNGSGIELHSSGNTVGGTLAGDGNVISGNAFSAIVISEGAEDNLVQGNYLGTNDAGTGAIGNDSIAVIVSGDGNQIGGDTAAESNVISGNAGGIDVNGDENVIQGNIIGLDAAGTAALGNDDSGMRIYGAGNVIGGDAAGEGNIVSANGGGITVGESATGTIVQGNYVGTDETGTVALGNSGIGIGVYGDGNQIGGAAAGAGNLVSDNANGIDVSGQDNVVEGNRIGTNAAGTAKLGEQGGGVRLLGPMNRLGGTAAGAGNLISGNDSGISVSGADGNVIEGNRIGTNAAGTAAVKNTSYAIRILGSTGTMIGGTAAGAGNLISGNERGVGLDDDAPGNVVQGNIIGLAADGMTALGNEGTGIEVSSGDNLIGGSEAGAGNVIASHPFYGIVFSGPDATGNVVQGNKIGTAADGTTLRGNWYNILFYGASGNVLGGTAAGEGNIIAGAANAGAYVWFGTHNELRGNSFFSNGGLGIELDPQGIAVNDLRDGDTGSNERQNMPVLMSAVLDGASLVIAGELSSRPSTSYDIDFYSSPSCDESGFGEGKTYLGSDDVVTDEDGDAEFEATLGSPGADTIITATATSPDGDTSEFSPCAVVDAGESAGFLQFSQEQYLGYEEEGSVLVTVARTGGATGTVTVHYATDDDTATAPADYTHVEGTLTFADGEVVKSFVVPLVLDGPDAEDQKIDLILSDPTGGASLGEQATSRVLLFDYDIGFPGVYISDATVVEGNAGTKNMQFQVTVTPTDHVISFKVRTTAGTAGDADYDDVDVDLSFQPGEAPKTVNVPVHGDTTDEDIEVLYLLVSGQIQPLGYAGDFGHGYILDDDGDPECGNMAVQSPETCDDGDLLYTAGDYCSPDCIAYECGIPTKLDGTAPKAGDALFVLKAAVQSTNCDKRVCDVNNSNSVTSTDSLIILKKAVGQPVTLMCPA